MVSISTCFDYTMSLDDQFKLANEVGFKHISLSSNYEHNGLLNSLEHIITLKNKYNMRIDTIHGCQIADNNCIDTLYIIAHAARKLESDTIVIHPCPFFVRETEVEDKLNILLSKASELENIAKRFNIKFALENLHPDGATIVLKRALDVMDKNYFGMCYDSTHAQIDGPRKFELLEEYRNRIIAVHISDRIKEFVDHVVPGEGFIDFSTVMKHLREIDYNKPILMEVLSDYTSFKNTKVLVKEAYNKAIELRRMLLNS
ncbi:hypothetical protein SH1V18_19480 [Vallitalea longa]|uniref:Xylose isomerase-like TIM barrel domain-containing protein n=1 Tax=Vallitalea longa TaxID=2936439 RepID=A0A9W5YBT2_9FIRM|nr:sugar phosphate isomerase/epimerase [Vallitalea longa]GKX29468.1 hypothetical protein SH1V18_19480 [Vallitalea longa]